MIRSTPRTLWLSGLALAILLMLLCYIIALNAYWVGDDYNYVGPKSWGAVLNFFNPVGRATYRPVNFLIWAGDFALFGDQPLGWRLTRLAIHALNIVSAALLVREITGRTGLALLAAALFAVHPAHTETVTWTGGQADISFAIAWLPALWLFVRWRRGAGRSTWVLAGVLGFLSMLGKEAALTLPLASLWIDMIFGRGWVRWPGRRDVHWWRDRGTLLKLVRDHSLFLAASGSILAMRLALFLTGKGRLMYGLEEQFGFFTRSVDVVAGYILLALGLWWLPPQLITWPLWVKLAIIASAGVAVIALVRWLGRIALFAAGWPAITLLFTLQAVANRWFYVPSLGVSLLVAAAGLRALGELRGTGLLGSGNAERQTRNAERRTRNPKRAALHVMASLPLIMLAWWSALTVVHNALWWESGEVARGLLAQVRALHPNPPRPATFYVANAPYSHKGVLLFNSGFGPSINLAYRDWTSIRSYELNESRAQVQAALADPSRVGPNPIFLRYEEGRIVEYPSLEALVAAEQREGATFQR